MYKVNEDNQRQIYSSVSAVYRLWEIYRACDC